MYGIDLSGKTALVTGGASGIGRVTALTLAQAGAHVAVVDLDLEGALKTAAGCQDGLALQCDLGDPDEVVQMAAWVQRETNGPDILFNNAGIIAYNTGIGAVDLAAWDRLLDVNLRGPFLLCRALIEGMKRRGWGRIINSASLAARVGGIEVGVHYASAKAGLIGLTRTLAKECGPAGITVNAIAPGIIATPPVQRQVAGHEDAYVAQIPLRRLGQPQDVANVVLFLASDLSAYMTGLVLDINGGQYMG
ncbi:MAG: SDR family oxidoreductase [Chloroflexi bacterium]|jgi:2-hydroxycyclohexanecarboxyl-CoA dehydrogenase|nr:SDR family oxidoreductase [Chloroflexota bacterium]